jgi:hypothetical protein
LKAEGAALPFAIPPLLLEGDPAPSLQGSCPGERFAAGPVPPAPVVETAPAPAPARGLACVSTERLPSPVQEQPGATAEAGLISQLGAPKSGSALRLAAAALPPAEAVAAPPPLAALPTAYGTGRLHLIAREPRCLYAQWDLSDEQLQACESRAAAGHLTLNLCPEEPRAEPHRPLELPPGARACFVAVERGGARWVAELGYWDTTGQWQSVATSEPAMAPRETLTTSASSVTLAQPPPPTAPRLPAGIPVGVSSPAGAPGGPEAPAARRGFWFNLSVELVIYGATEPEAKVTVGGRLIKLRPDGTFSLRLALADGQYELPLVAISAADDDGRSAMLQFSRHTDYWGAANAPEEVSKTLAELNLRVPPPRESQSVCKPERSSS